MAEGKQPTQAGKGPDTIGNLLRVALGCPFSHSMRNGFQQSLLWLHLHRQRKRAHAREERNF